MREFFKCTIRFKREFYYIMLGVVFVCHTPVKSSHNTALQNNLEKRELQFLPDWTLFAVTFWKFETQIKFFSLIHHGNGIEFWQVISIPKSILSQEKSMRETSLSYFYPYLYDCSAPLCSV